MKKIVLTFGLIAGGILSVSMLATIPFMDRIGFDKAMVIGYTTMVVAFLLVYFGVRTYRDNEAGGTISFGKAFQVGILITLIACVCYVLTWEFIYHNITPDFFDKYSQYVLDKAQAAGATAEQLAARRREMEEFKTMYANPLINAAMTFVEPFPVGLVITLLCAGILSRKRQERVAGLAVET
jgi:hypothetical protein